MANAKLTGREAVRVGRRVRRPTAIEFAWTDPWTGEFCAGAYMPYTRERMVSGFYRRQILAMKNLAKTWTGPRTPKLKMVVHRVG